MDCPAAVRELKQRWIGRGEQIDRLVRILGPREAMVSPVFVGGLPSSGKSAVVRDLFQALALPHAYINCIESSTPRLVFEAALNQLHGHVPTVANGFGPFEKCADLARFVQLLSDAVFRGLGAPATAPSSPASPPRASIATSPLSSPPPALEANDAAALEEHAARMRLMRADGGVWAAEETQYIILDNAERLRALDRTLLQALLRLPNLTNRNITCILISNVPVDYFVVAAASSPLTKVWFEPYSKAELADILALSCPHPGRLEGYKEMIKLILGTCLDQCPSLLELEQVAASTWRVVAEALEAGDITAKDPSKIYRLIKPILRQALARSLCLPSALDTYAPHDAPHAPPPAPAEADSCPQLRRDPEGQGPAALSHGRLLDVELPYYSKHLLVAAFLSSYNPASRDVATFSLSSTGPMKKKKRGGREAKGWNASARKGAKGAGDATNTSSDSLLQAPQTFGLERLLAIFYTLVVDPIDASVDLISEVSLFLLPSHPPCTQTHRHRHRHTQTQTDTDTHRERDTDTHTHTHTHTSGTQVHGLVALGLLRRVGKEEHLGDSKMVCRASFQLVQTVAADVRVDLPRFLHYQ